MLSLYEILVPTLKGQNSYFSTKHHKLWDAKVLSIANGLTILQPNKGHWQSLHGELVSERVIPVRIACTKEQIKEIMDMTAKHYNQLAVMAYLISSEVLIEHYVISPSILS